ncbi:MAG TPA: hypothetical protein VD767_06380 [Thermomicrobiales bacterium]|nr:hypothetical protein [Thermomicrobiales bacterium]
MHSTSDDNQASDSQPKSRLDREIEEILARTSPSPESQAPIPFQRPNRAPSRHLTIPPQLTAVLQVPILQALILAIAAWLVDGLSPLLASILALAAVVCILLPMARGGRVSKSNVAPEARMWRGQVIDATPAQPKTPIESLRTWWDNRRR